MTMWTHFVVLVTVTVALLGAVSGVDASGRTSQHGRTTTPTPTPTPKTTKTTPAASTIGTSNTNSRHEVKGLPGWAGPLPSIWHSGWLDAGIAPNGLGLMHEHYIFVESEGNPAKDPVVVWYQGGPGASSMFGLLAEFGPLLLTTESLSTAEFRQSGIPSLIRNEYSWSKHANLLIVDNPTPVGFSYCDPAGVTGGGTSCGNWTDTAVASSNLLFLENFVETFPEFAANPLYIVGESYAGVYVPIIVEALLNAQAERKERKLAGNGVNLQGFAVGDGCMGNQVLCGNHQIPYAYWSALFFCGHGQLSNAFCEKMYATCPKNQKETAACKSITAEMMKILGGFHEYALYDDCWYSAAYTGGGQIEGQNDGQRDGGRVVMSVIPATPLLMNDAEAIGTTSHSKRWWSSKKQTHPSLFSSLSSPSSSSSFSASPKSPPLLNGPTVYCGGTAQDIWLNRTDVRAALYVPANAYFFSGDNGVGFNYTTNYRDVLPIYYRALTQTNLRVLVYNGDADPSINSFITQDRYVNYFAQAKTAIPETEAWRAWTLDGQQYMGGYTTGYANNQFVFATIRGSGHMVPEFKPKAAYAMLTNFLQGNQFPRFQAATPAGKR